MSRALSVAGVLLFSSAVFAQSADPSLSFEVASIKPAAPQTEGRFSVGMRGGPGSPDPGQITYNNVALKDIIRNAYNVKHYQIQGPSWLDSERFDLKAKVPRGATKEDVRVMLQNLLKERFKLTLHHDSKEMPMYALVVAKNGPKLTPSAEEPAPPETDGSSPGGPREPPPPDKLVRDKEGFPVLPKGGRGGMMMMVTNGRIRMQANHQTMSGFADMLGNSLDRPVVDMTGVKGNYDIKLDYMPDEMQQMRGPMGMMPKGPPPGAEAGGMPGATASDPSSGPTLFTALQEQLGLKLEPKKGPVDLIVVDSIEKTPTEN